MKIVVNKCYGGFSVSKKVVELLGLESEYDANRYDPRLIELIEKYGVFVSGECANLRVIEIPDEATDHHVDDYDGYEDVIYVVDGKLHWA